MKYRVKNIKMRRCRVCGCTNYHACPGGCFWVEKDLCSKCAAKMNKDHNSKDSSMITTFISNVNAFLAGEVECGHTIPMSEYLNSLSLSERENCIIINPANEFQLISKSLSPDLIDNLVKSDVCSKE
jgi:hypothetical protein